MAEIDVACDTCNSRIGAEFNPGSGARTLEIIAGELSTTEQCFVRDEIRFLNGGRLVFNPTGGKEYHRHYYVICRKLVVVGGHKPGTFNPCGPDTPGSEYAGNNAITWRDRLKAAADGPTHPTNAADGESFNPNNWSNQGQGNSGKDGGKGTDGAKGNNGNNGVSGPDFTLIALEIDMGLGDHLVIDFDGQTGGDGGPGQKGGKGGVGMGGRIGDSDTTWPGTGCDRQPGHGGDGGDGGNGGSGGDGGRGGAGGDIFILSTAANLASGPLVDGHFSYINDGGTGGSGGKTGVGGFGGKGGKAGFKTSECDQASDGDDGDPGIPEPGTFADPNPGGPGATGAAGKLTFEELKRDSCASLIPIDAEFSATGLQPATLCRGFSAPATEQASITGDHFDQITGASTSLANVTVTKKPSSTDTQLDLTFSIAGNSGLGGGDLIFTRAFGPDQTLPNALTIKRFEVLSVTPNTGAKGTMVAVQIVGECFDPTAAIQQVNVSGLSVDVLNVVVLDAQHIDCVFDIKPLAASGARNVTAKTGALQHTLASAFTIT